MNQPVQNILLSNRLRERTAALRHGWLRLLSGVAVRIVLFVVSFAVTAWLLFNEAWLPLQGEVTLPAGVSTEDPVLELNKIKTIISEQTNMAKYVPPSYDKQGKLFVLQSTPKTE